MITSPIELAASLHVGTVIFVSPGEVKVQLEIEAPDSIALNAGTPRAFPRVNGYLLIPCDGGYLVGQVQWITVEDSPYPKRKGLQDFGLVDLPFPLRKLSLAPLGLLRQDVHRGDYTFRRGFDAFPSIGGEFVLPTKEQLKSIVGSGDNLRVKIGTSPLAGNAEVLVDPDRLFSRHLAVLGNTGSGKSCSVAGLIHWSLDAAQSALVNKGECSKPVNSRFVILDPNGEYSKAFNPGGAVHVFSVEPKEGAQQLRIPIWFLNSSEWCSLSHASARAQRPTMVEALRYAKSGTCTLGEQSVTVEKRKFLKNALMVLKAECAAGTPFGSFPKPKNFCAKIAKWNESDFNAVAEFSEEQQRTLAAVRDKITQLAEARKEKYSVFDFSNAEISDLIKLVEDAYFAFDGSSEELLGVDAEAPKPYTAETLVNSLETAAELLGASEYVDTLIMRVQSLLSDSRVKSVMVNDTALSLDGWLKDYIGSGEDPRVSMIDLSLLPAEIVHIFAAVISRMIFEALQRYRKINSSAVVPTVLVVEEAHAFIKRYSDTDDESVQKLCSGVFEKIAREGRKFGLGLVLSSQRPSELSPTVLSQCNSFLLHRISNDRDQELVQKLLPDNLHGLLRDLPILPSRHAILLGWAAELPMLVRMNDIPADMRPQSEDPDYWNVWTLGRTCNVDWNKVEEDWVGPGNK